MNTLPERLGPFFVGLYAWIVTVFLGAVLLDICYARLVPEAAAAFSEAADFLLLIGGVTFLAAIGAISFGWNSKIARNYFIASLVILFLEFFFPVLFAQLKDTTGSGLTTAIRIVINGMASVLTFMGLYRFYKE